MNFQFNLHSRGSGLFEDHSHNTQYYSEYIYIFFSQGTRYNLGDLEKNSRRILGHLISNSNYMQNIFCILAIKKDIWKVTFKRDTRCVAFFWEILDYCRLYFA